MFPNHCTHPASTKQDNFFIMCLSSLYKWSMYSSKTTTPLKPFMLTMNIFLLRYTDGSCPLTCLTNVTTLNTVKHVKYFHLSQQTKQWWRLKANWGKYLHVIAFLNGIMAVPRHAYLHFYGIFYCFLTARGYPRLGQEPEGPQTQMICSGINSTCGH